jgi:hypothetical protein
MYIAFYSYEYYETANANRNIVEDGFSIFHIRDYKEIDISPSETLVRAALARLPEGYCFLNYSYAIKNTTLSTFHRDVTSSQVLYNTRHPVYTLILYKYEGCLLSLCPGSHATYPFVISQIVNVQGPAGTCFLFNCDVLHAGCSNRCQYREIIQYKICHRDDIEQLEHLNNVAVIKEETDCRDDWTSRFLRKCSYFFELPINTIFNPLLQKKQDDNVVGKLQEAIPIQFYNNT